jgi:hypothetical protein
MDNETAYAPAGTEPLRSGSPGRRGLLMGAGLAGAVGVAGALLRSTDASAQSTPPAGGVTVLAPSGDATGGKDTTAINTALGAGFPVLLSPGLWYITGISMPASGAKLYGSGCQMPGDPAPSDTYCTIIHGGSAAANGDPMIEIPLGVSEVEIKNLHLNGQIADGGGNLAPVIDFPDDTSLDNNSTLIERVSLENSGGDGIYIGKNRAAVTLLNGWSFGHPSGAAVNIQGSSTTVINFAMSGSEYGFILYGTVSAIMNSQIFGNTTNQITGGNNYIYGCSIDHTGNTGIVVLNSVIGISIHARFEGNNENENTGTSPGSGSYHLDASGAGPTHGSGSLCGPAGVNILPGTHFTNNSFGAWKVTYDICTGGNTALVNDWSTYDDDYNVGHIF